MSNANKTLPRALALCVTALGVAWSVGCASSSAEPSAKAGDAAAVEQPAPPQQQASPEAGTSLKPSSTAKPTLDEALSDVTKAEKELSDALDPTKPIPLATDRCSIICKALSSMRNATGRLCELTTDDRCDDAKAHLAKAETRAKEACPVCSGT